MPANDVFASATTLASGGGTLTSSNATATLEAGEQRIYEPDIGGASVWFKYVATATTMLHVDTIGSDFDTILGVWTGTTLGSLTLVADDDESGEAIPGTPGYRSSSLDMPIVLGETYWIEVDGYEPDGQFGNPDPPYGRGTIVLNWAPLVLHGGDLIVNAYALSGDTGTVHGDSSDAGNEAGEFGPNSDTPRAHTVWFKFTSTKRGVLTLFVKGLVYYAMYRQTNLPAGPQVAALQELTSSSSSSSSSETWNQTFYNPEFGPLFIQVGADTGDPFTLRWDLQAISDDMRWIAG